MALYYYSQHDQIVLIESASTPGTGWVSVANFQTAVNTARSANLPLFLRPGTYNTGALSVTTGTGGGNPLNLIASPGTATIRLNAAGAYLLQVDSVANCNVSGVTFDGDNRSLSGGSPQGIVRFTGSGAYNFIVQNCRIFNSGQAGIAVGNSAQGRILNNTISTCKVGIYCNDGLVLIERNVLDTLGDNGIMVWTSTITGNGSQVIGNHINGVNNVSGGTGEYGNGILVFRAGNVKIMQNTVYSCRYSGIRVNAATNTQVVGNYCWSSREVAIFIEAPSSGLDLTGCIVSDNIIDTAGTGISVANAGLYGDGIARRALVSNNIISNMKITPIPDPGYSPPYTSGTGISVELSCNVAGNTIEDAEGAGISLGTNDAASNLTATGNLIINAPMGIGYSSDNDARAILIASNLIRGYRNISNISDPNYAVSGAIVSQSFDGTNYTRNTSGGTANTDYGNTSHATAGSLTVGMKQASV